MIATKKHVEDEISKLHSLMTLEFGGVETKHDIVIRSVKNSIADVEDRVMDCVGMKSEQTNGTFEAHLRTIRDLQDRYENLAHHVNALADYLGVEFVEAGVKAVKKAKR